MLPKQRAVKVMAKVYCFSVMAEKYWIMKAPKREKRYQFKGSELTQCSG
jgi:hypothetical protein